MPFMVIVTVFIMVIMIVFIMVVVTFFVVVFGMEAHVECRVFSMDFDIICVLLFINKFEVFVWAFCERLTQVGHKHTFVVKRVLSVRHGVDFNRSRGVIAQGGEGCFNPRFEAESVVEEQIGILQTNQIRSRRFVIVHGYVVLAHVFHGDLVASDAFDKFSNVVC